jgi:Rab-GTPase-TBC domain
MLDGDKRWSKAGSSLHAQQSLRADLANTSGSAAQGKSSSGSNRVLSTDELSLSTKVRNMYEYGVEDPALVDQTVLEEDEEEEKEDEPASSLQSPTGTAITGETSPGLTEKPIHYPRHSPSRTSVRRDAAGQRQPFETAGGIEDWEDVKGEQVDRYGFIMARKEDSRGSTGSGGTYNHNVTTSLLEISNAPRRKQSILRRVPSRASSRTGYHSDGVMRQASTRRRSGMNQTGNDAASSVYQNRSVTNSHSSLRSHMARHDRRLLVEAADMLTLPPGAAEDAAANGLGKLGGGATMTKAMREKEWQREAKWKKMGRLQSAAAGRGGGMQFDFDPRDPKIIARTWKGIPDKWRAMAWYSFLQASADRHSKGANADELVTSFHELQNEASADDVQIDCDVPRTITRHIMFRRRYRGGQRLLFRVLHALSLYFPEVGYVQGMAALAATLLCYYDEEKTFVMMVRLWQLRGLERLYESGFEGLMEALGEFEKEWLRDGAVAKKLVCTTLASHIVEILINLHRRNLVLKPQRMARDGTSHSSTTRFHFLLSYVYGMCLCFSATNPTLVRQFKRVIAAKRHLKSVSLQLLVPTIKHR